MDVHTLEAPLGAWSERISSSTMPLDPTRGQWLPYRGLDMEIASFPPPSAHLSGGRGFKPHDRQKLFGHKIQLLAWRDDNGFHSHADFPSHTTCALLTWTFLPRFLLPLESLSKLLTLTWTHTGFPICLFYPSAHKPSLGNLQFKRALWVCKNTNNLYSHSSVSSSLYIIWSFVVLGK